MTVQTVNFSVNAKELTNLFNGLKNFYKVEPNDTKNKEIADIVKEKGYLPVSHIDAIEKLSPAQILVGMEEKFKNSFTYDGKSFVYENLSPVKRAGFKNSNWIKKEQHNIKLINLCALGNGNVTTNTAKFIEILAQFLTLPSGVLENEILNTTIYILPFHPREFGCAYLPKSSDVSETLCDHEIYEKFGLNAKQQVQALLAFAQLAGHPIMYDVLPQTARYSKAVLAKPYIARWFDVKELIQKIENEIENLNCADKMKVILKAYLNGQYCEIDRKLQCDFEKALDDLLERKKEFSNSMLSRKNQNLLQKRVKNIVLSLLNIKNDKELEEDDILEQTKLISALISEGLWPAPGGAWNSCGGPVFDCMCAGASYPIFKHFNVYDEDVSRFANLDCQTPYYFFNFDTKTFNDNVIDFYINYLKKLQKDFNFDGYRVDHIDHIVDKVSQFDELPISYRAPKVVLAKANKEMKSIVPHFATLAEYMLWDGFLKEYHIDMGFDLLWGNDIISQSDKKVARIFSDLKELEEYNSKLPENISKLSILKSYNNQDGEFAEIDQYPGQLGEDGALLKFFKYKFIVGGPNAQRPVMYVDGDESFTKTGTEFAIGNETSLKRENHNEFFKKFNAIIEFAKTCKFCKWGKSYLLRNDEDGFVAWVNSLEGYDNQVLFVVNENYPSEKIRRYGKNGNLIIENVIGQKIKNKMLDLGSNVLLSEFIYMDGKFLEKNIENTDKLFFETINPAQYYIYRITNR